MNKKQSNSRIKHLVPNNPEVDRATKDPKEVSAERRAIKNTLYDSSYRTAVGHWKRRDEPDADAQLRQSDAIQARLKAQRAAAGRSRLKSKNAVPTKQGKKLFEEFIMEASAHRPPRGKTRINTRELDDLHNAYNAASALEFDKWVIFVSDLLDADI